MRQTMAAIGARQALHLMLVPPPHPAPLAPTSQPKSELRWEKPQARAKTKEEAAPPPAPPQQHPTGIAPPPAVAPEQHPTGIALLRTRVLPEGMSEVAANWIDGDAPVSLMVAEELSGPAGVGGSWIVPPYNMNASDGVSFAGRFAPVVKSGHPQPN